MFQPKVTEIVLDSGVRAHIAPLSRYQRNALIEESEAIFPLPDKKLYEQALSEDIAIPGSVIPAEENPEYQALVKNIRYQRDGYVSQSILNLCTTFPDYPNRQDLIDFFAADIQKQREFMTLPDDPWQATLRFAVIGSHADETQILGIARDDVPVTEKEVNDNVRIFQPVLSREKSRILDYARKHAPGAETKVPDNQ